MHTIPSVKTENQEQNRRCIEIFIDGSCVPNPGHMGVGVVFGVKTHTLSQYFGVGSNQKAELLALKTAIIFARSGDQIFSDSRYALKVCIGNWQARIHLDLVKDIKCLLKGKRVAFHWVRGHQGHGLQEMADRLAKQAAKTRRSRIDSPSDLLSRAGLGGFGHDVSEIP